MEKKARPRVEFINRLAPINLVSPSRFLGPSSQQINKNVVKQYQRTYPVHASMKRNNQNGDEKKDSNIFKFDDQSDDQFTNVQLP